MSSSPSPPFPSSPSSPPAASPQEPSPVSLHRHNLLSSSLSPENPRLREHHERPTQTESDGFFSPSSSSPAKSNPSDTFKTPPHTAFPSLQRRSCSIEDLTASSSRSIPSYRRPQGDIFPPSHSSYRSRRRAYSSSHLDQELREEEAQAAGDRLRRRLKRRALLGILRREDRRGGGSRRSPERKGKEGGERNPTRRGGGGEEERERERGREGRRGRGENEEEKRERDEGVSVMARRSPMSSSYDHFYDEDGILRPHLMQNLHAIFLQGPGEEEEDDGWEEERERKERRAGGEEECRRRRRRGREEKEERFHPGYDKEKEEEGHRGSRGGGPQQSFLDFAKSAVKPMIERSTTMSLLMKAEKEEEEERGGGERDPYHMTRIKRSFENFYTQTSVHHSRHLKKSLSSSSSLGKPGVASPPPRRREREEEEDTLEKGKGESRSRHYHRSPSRRRSSSLSNQEEKIEEGLPSSSSLHVQSSSSSPPPSSHLSHSLQDENEKERDRGHRIHAGMKRYRRGRWRSKEEYILTSMSYAVGLGNIWRFPYLCYENGGGSFLIAYFVCLSFLGLPMFILESSVGQKMQTGFLRAWRQISAVCTGIGLSSVCLALICAVYYNVILSWCLFFFFNSFTAIGKSLPWSKEGGGTGINDVDAVKRFFLVDCLQKSSSMGGGSPEGLDVSFNVSLLICLLIAWTLSFLSLWKSLRPTGKVFYFTAIVPYIGIVLMLFRGITLPGAGAGLYHYFAPQWGLLVEPRTWAVAGSQSFFSLGIAWGSLVNYASFNPIKNDISRDALLITGLSALTAFLVGLSVFSIIGHMALVSHQPVEEVARVGSGLAFLAYPYALTTLPLSWVCSMCFFLLFICMGIDSQFVMLEVIMTACIEVSLFRSLPTAVFAFLLCLLLFLVGILFISSSGIYWVNLLDTFAGTVSLFLVALCEVLAVVLHYDFRNLVILRQTSSFSSSSGGGSLEMSYASSSSSPPLQHDRPPCSSSSSLVIGVREASPSHLDAFSSYQCCVEKTNEEDKREKERSTLDEETSLSLKPAGRDSYRKSIDLLTSCSSPSSPLQSSLLLSYSASTPPRSTPQEMMLDAIVLTDDREKKECINYDIKTSRDVYLSSSSSSPPQRGDHSQLPFVLVSPTSASNHLQTSPPSPDPLLISSSSFPSPSPRGSCSSSPSPLSHAPPFMKPHTECSTSASSTAAPCTSTSSPSDLLSLYQPSSCLQTSLPIITQQSPSPSSPHPPSPSSPLPPSPSSPPPPSHLSSSFPALSPRDTSVSSTPLSRTMKTKRLQLFSFFLLSSPHLRRFLTIIVPPFLWLLTLCGLVWFASPSSPHAGLGQRQRDVKGVGCLGSPNACSGHGRCVLCDEELEALAPMVMDELAKKKLEGHHNLSGGLKLLQVSPDGKSVEEEEDEEKGGGEEGRGLEIKSRASVDTSARKDFLPTRKTEEKEDEEKTKKGGEKRDEVLLLGDQTSIPEKIGSLLHGLKKERRKTGGEDEDKHDRKKTKERDTIEKGKIQKGGQDLSASSHTVEKDNYSDKEEGEKKRASYFQDREGVIERRRLSDREQAYGVQTAAESERRGFECLEEDCLQEISEKGESYRNKRHARKSKSTLIYMDRQKEAGDDDKRKVSASDTLGKDTIHGGEEEERRGQREEKEEEEEGREEEEEDREVFSHDESDISAVSEEKNSFLLRLIRLQDALHKKGEIDTNPPASLGRQLSVAPLSRDKERSFLTDMISLSSLSSLPRSPPSLSPSLEPSSSFSSPPPSHDTSLRTARRLSSSTPHGQEIPHKAPVPQVEKKQEEEPSPSPPSTTTKEERDIVTRQPPPSSSSDAVEEKKRLCVDFSMCFCHDRWGGADCSERLSSGEEKWCPEECNSKTGKGLCDAQIGLCTCGIEYRGPSCRGQRYAEGWPDWGLAIGWLVALGTVVPIPLVMLARSVRRRVKRRLDEGTEAQQEEKHQLELQSIQHHPRTRGGEQERQEREREEEEERDEKEEEEDRGRSRRGSRVWRWSAYRRGGRRIRSKEEEVGSGGHLHEEGQRESRIIHRDSSDRNVSHLPRFTSRAMDRIEKNNRRMPEKDKVFYGRDRGGHEDEDKIGISRKENFHDVVVKGKQVLISSSCRDGRRILTAMDGIEIDQKKRRESRRSRNRDEGGGGSEGGTPATADLVMIGRDERSDTRCRDSGREKEEKKEKKIQRGSHEGEEREKEEEEERIKNLDPLYNTPAEHHHFVVIGRPVLLPEENKLDPLSNDNSRRDG
ncbi:sodium:neurotransmitter symporter family protein [Cystoisospora suis]|uniref:Transporter n=1 Tax=Cystoisospora suis TaxID=483139 RepID=A0A2C6KNV0_9APIC|nr:sodium:neurotransmitter symporter family protein [Cystoisospora suis]